MVFACFWDKVPHPWLAHDPTEETWQFHSNLPTSHFEYLENNWSTPNKSIGLGRDGEVMKGFVESGTISRWCFTRGKAFEAVMGNNIEVTISKFVSQRRSEHLKNRCNLLNLGVTILNKVFIYNPFFFQNTMQNARRNKANTSNRKRCKPI
jgi:hypothetical protein